MALRDLVEDDDSRGDAEAPSVAGEADFLDLVGKGDAVARARFFRTSGCACFPALADWDLELLTVTPDFPFFAA